MDLRQLKYFVSVMECGSLTRAAAVLHLSQPTLGEHMRNLENEFGVELFVRHSRGISATPAALLLKERAEHLLAYAHETGRLLRAASDSVQGNVTLGVSPGLNELFSADLIERFRDALPGVSMNIVEDLSAALVERMVKGSETLDFALVSGFDVSDATPLHRTTIGSEELFLVGRPERLGESGVPYPFVELTQHALLLLGSGDGAKPYGLRRLLLQQAAALGIELRIVAEVRSISALRDLLLRDAGVTILPLFSVRQALDTGALVARRLCEPSVWREIHLIEPANSSQCKAAAAARGLLLDLIEAQLDVVDGPLQRLGV